MSDSPPDQRLADARRWLGQAYEDLDAAKHLAPIGPARVVCFLAHLSVEKTTKAVLLAKGTPFRKVHDLFQLRSLLDASAAALLSDTALAALNPWVIEGRYPGDLDEATDALSAELVDLAGALITALAALIGE